MRKSFKICCIISSLSSDPAPDRAEFPESRCFGGALVRGRNVLTEEICETQQEQKKERKSGTKIGEISGRGGVQINEENQ
jgi:hypothetical protein